MGLKSVRIPLGPSLLWMEGYTDGRFIHQVDPKAEYLAVDCWNNPQHRLLEFLVPFVHPDRPTRVTITIGNTIFGALNGGREVDWGVVFRDLTQRLAKGVGKFKSTPICPFLFHLYKGQGLLTEDEELDYRTAKEMAGYRITSDPDSRHESDDEGAAPIPTPPLVQETPVPTPNRRRKTKGVTSGPVEGAFESGSTRAIADSIGTTTYTATGSSTGMDSKALCRGDCEPPTGKETIPWDGGGTRGDRLRIGSRAQGDNSEDPVSPQGPGDGGT